MSSSSSGIYDLAGNVWEWCLNKYEDPNKPASLRIDDTGKRVVRGGSWNDNPGNLRSSIRVRNDTDYRNNYLGFRLVQDIDS